MGQHQYLLEKQHEKGKYHAIERILLLLDKGSFCEIGKHIGAYGAESMGPDHTPYDGVITGYGTVNGRQVFVFSQDFTVRGGSIGRNHGKKIAHIIELAIRAKKPVIGIYDSGGARIDEGMSSLAGCGDMMYQNIKASGVIPQISVVLGPCAGAASYSPAITDFVFSVRKVGYMFVTGPDVIKSVTGEQRTADELGGAQVHAETSGVVHFLCRHEKECMQRVRSLVDLLPDTNELKAEGDEGFTDKDCPALEALMDMPIKQSYDVLTVIRDVFDDNSFLEVHKHFARSMVVGFARLCGTTVGIVANQPSYNGGVLDCDSSDKAARFVRFCDEFHIPVITFVDTPGYLPGVDQEHNGIIRHGAKLLFAYGEAETIKLTVVLRKAYGGAYIAMGSKHMGADLVYVLPTAQIAVMGAEGAVKTLHRRSANALPEEERSAFLAEKTREYEESFMNGEIALANGYADMVVTPGKLRKRLYQDVLLLRNKRADGHTKKHGNIPL
ncbi:MAG: acyl-CoA carboxylase subunit beta [Oscillospiraceae bacterium]|nr:acyl-CoA carboxylase subunit beta [Oscillospiraceae bacterium]